MIRQISVENLILVKRLLEDYKTTCGDVGSPKVDELHKEINTALDEVQFIIDCESE